MAQERIEIIVTEKGARQVRRSLEGIGDGASKAGRAMQSLNGLLKGAITFETVRVLQLTADAYTTVQNALKQVTDSTSQLNAVTDELFNISQRTRTSFESNAEAYRRFALAGKDLGLSQRDVLDFTEKVNQAIKISGASFVEAQAGIIQFSQGLSAGRLSGDELRSVLEQLPTIADIIAKELKVTRSELRQLGADGKITSQVIINAFKNATGLSQQFAKTIPTISESFLALRNEFVKYVGELDKANGISASVSKGILFLADNFDMLARAVMVVASVITVNLVRGALVSMVVALSNPITALIALTAAFAAFGDQLTIGIGTIATYTDVAIAMAQSVWGIFKNLFSVLGDILAGFGIDAGKMWKGFTDFFREAFSNAGYYVLGVFEITVNSLLRFIEHAINGMRLFWNFVADADKQIEGSPLNTLGSVNAEQILAKAEYNRQQAELQAALREQQLKKDRETLNRAINGTGLNTIPKPVDKEALKEAERALKRQKELLEEITSGGINYAQRIGDLNVLLRQGKISQDQYNQALDETNKKLLENDRTLNGGYQRGLLELKDQFGDLSVLAENTLVNAFQSAEDALVQFVTTGKLDFKSFADSIIADLARIAIRQAIIQPLLSSVFGFDFKKDGGIVGMATGGLFNGVGGPREDKNLVALSDGEFVVNAASTRKYLPLLEAINGNGVSTGSGARLQPAGGGGTSNSFVYAPEIHVTVEGGGSGNNTDPDQANRLGETVGKQLEVLMEKKFAEFTREAQRPGGQFSSSTAGGF